MAITPLGITYPTASDSLTPNETHFAALATSADTAIGKVLPKVASLSARNVRFPSPVQGDSCFRSDKGRQETYFGAYNASTNPGGRPGGAGWYDVLGLTKQFFITTYGDVGPNFNCELSGDQVNLEFHALYSPGFPPNSTYVPFTLPLGFRPAKPKTVPMIGFSTGTSVGSSVLTITPAGVTTFYTGGSVLTNFVGTVSYKVTQLPVSD